MLLWPIVRLLKSAVKLLMTFFCPSNGRKARKAMETQQQVIKSLTKQLKEGNDNPDGCDNNADYLKMLTADIPTIFVGDRCPLWGKDYLRIPRSIVEWSALKTAVKPNVALLQQSSENMVIVIPAELCKKLAAIDAGMGFDIE